MSPEAGLLKRVFPLQQVRVALEDVLLLPEQERLEQPEQRCQYERKPEGNGFSLGQVSVRSCETPIHACRRQG